jgi:hypothetical protein
MENIIEEYYYKSTEGLNENLLQNKNDWYDYVQSLPEAEQITYTIILFHSQVENGGFHQYFFNSYGQFVFLTIENLKFIGAIKQYDLLTRALNLVNEDNFEVNKFREYIFNRKLRKIVDFDVELMNQLSILDDEYYNIDSEEIYQLLENYLSSKNR